MTTKTGIPLRLVAGEYRLSGCECRIHIWDGLPLDVTAQVEIIAGRAMTKNVLIGKVAPHLHVDPACKVHASINRLVTSAPDAQGGQA